jgi:hypothetical protein
VHTSGYKTGKGKKLLDSMMEEVHTNSPLTCPKAGCSEAQLRAIAFSKTRAAALKMHKPKAAKSKVFYD